MTKKSEPQIIVITTEGDAHLPFVEPYLPVKFTVIDPQRLLKATELSFRFNKHDDLLQVTFGDTIFSNITGVWYRKPQPIVRNDIPVPEDYKIYAHASLERAILQLLTAFPEATWLSDYFAILRSNNKTLQLVTARQVGFNVPETLVTTSADKAQAFLQNHPSSISKPLTIAFPKVNGQQKILLTTRIEANRIPDLSGLHLAPSIFQEAIDFVDDVRVVVVGDTTFGAAVRTPEEGNAAPEYLRHVRDNRLGHYNGSVEITEIDLPQDIAQKCINHTKQLGLKFGAIDLLVDKKGTWWFLENNPNGQWAYIEEATGQPIGKAIAALLTSGLH